MQVFVAGSFKGTSVNSCTSHAPHGCSAVRQTHWRRSWFVYRPAVSEYLARLPQQELDILSAFRAGTSRKSGPR